MIKSLAYVGVNSPRAEDWRRFGTGFLGGELAQVLPAVWQLATSGTDAQRQAAADVLADTRRKLYGLLAAGDEEHTVTAEQIDEPEEPHRDEPGPDPKP